MQYHLIISDFDGTFRHRDTTIGEKTLSAVREFENRGGKFVICTGRMPSSIRPVLLQRGMQGLYVAYQGSIIAEVQSGKVLHSVGFTKAQALRICRAMECMGLRIHAYDEENCYVNYRDGQLETYERICAIRSVDIDGKMSDFLEKKEGTVFKLIAMVRKEERLAVRDELRRRLGEEEFYISCSASTLVEATAIRATKGTAVQFLSEYYKIEKERILAFGDNQNDIPLIEAAGRGVAVANADEQLKTVADEVYGKSCDEDAVGDYIEKYVL